MKHLTTDQLINTLAIRDLSDPTQGEHAMQILVDKILTGLSKLWNTDYTVYRETPIVTVNDNYDALGIATDNVTRSERYTRYISDNVCLRTMISVLVPRGLKSIKDKINPSHLLATVGLVYRRDQIDKNHVGEVHQMDLWYTSKNPLTWSDMEDMVQTIVNCIDPSLKWRLVETGHPYTTNGVQCDVWWNDQWLEILECGLTHPKILDDNIGEGYYGLAMGPGLDRLLMIAKNITDIRLLRSEDSRIKNQMNDLSEYKPVSSMPPVKRDISIIVDENDDAETIGDMVRMALPNNEMIEEVSILSETHYNDLPESARMRTKIQPNQKNLLIRIVLRSLERTLTSEECNEYRNIIYTAVHQGAVAETC